MSFLKGPLIVLFCRLVTVVETDFDLFSALPLAAAAFAMITASPLLQTHVAHLASFIRVVAVPAIVVFTLTYVGSLIKFHWTRKSADPHKTAPTIPHSLPWLCHAFLLEWSMASFLKTTVKRWGYSTPLKVQAGTFQFTMVTNPSHIRCILRSSRILTNRPMMMFVMRKWFYTPLESMHHYAAHQSAAAGSKKEHLHDLQASISIRFLSGQSLLAMSERYLAILKRRLARAEIPQKGELVIEDFFTWLQSQVTPSVIEAMMGSRILEMYPQLVEDFWEFDRNIANYSRGLPRWLIPSAYRTRDRLLANIKAWNQLAHRHSDCGKSGADDPEWDEFFGTKFIKAREETLKRYGLDDDAIASENLGLLFGSNANAVRAVFWYVFEALKDQNLRERLHAELQECLSPRSSTFDLTRFSAKPLLQSTYAEVLRLRVATTMTRTKEDSDFRLGPDYVVPRNMTMTIFSSITAQNKDAWSSVRPQSVERPLSEFWPERFLVHRGSNKEATFSVEGLTECWMPYGGGQRMCPGRHFAKNEIIGTLGLLLEMFDCELVDQRQAEQVKPDERWVPYGTLPPTRKVAVRLRRR